MSERTLRVAGAGLATIGATITAYLLYARWTGGSFLCSTGGCETVQSSRYAEVLGVPVAALGLVGFSAYSREPSHAASGRGSARQHSPLPHCSSALYLLVVQLAAIGAVCQWCLGADLVTTAIAAVALLRWRFCDLPR